MPYIPPEVVARAREMDLLTYLRTYAVGKRIVEIQNELNKEVL